MKTNENKDLLEFDKTHIWHPYASAMPEAACLLVERAQGVRFQLEDGTWLIDGMSSWWSAIHGYNHPVLNAAVQKQCDKMAHIMFGGLTHRPAMKLTEALLSIAPQGLNHIFFSDSGSVAVEVAMKMALQYWQSKGEDNKNQFVTIKKGYHGDTWHAMSVCDPVTGMHHIFNSKLSVQHFLPPPQTAFDHDFEAEEMHLVKDFLEENHQHLAAFILEPIVQGAGGMRFYHPHYLKEVKGLCEKYGVLLIADEIATGFGRTGKMFACEYAEITPDIMCLGKALTGGYLSFAATLCMADVAEFISQGSPGVFMHGPTFMGNPLACSLALASLQLLQKNNYDISYIEQELKEGLGPLKALDVVNDVRVLGAIGVVEMKENVDMSLIQHTCLTQGIWLRPFGKLIYTMPPFIISRTDLKMLIDGIVQTIRLSYKDHL